MNQIFHGGALLMKIGKKMEKSINSQIQAEFESSYLYLSMAAWFEDAIFPDVPTGWKNRLRKSGAREILQVLMSRGGRVELAR